MNFFEDKKVFVTGHTGFKGTWLLHLLKHLGANVKGFALPAHHPSLFNITKAAEFCKHVEGDIRNKNDLEKELLDFEPDFVFHLAAQPLVLDSYKDPVYTFEVNQMGTVYLLDALKKLDKTCTCIVVTTDKVYKDQNKFEGYLETDTVGGFDPYSASKAGCELIVDSYRNSFFHPEKYLKHRKSIATARAGNVIGGGDFAENRLIPDIIKSIEKNRKVVIRNPEAIRPWQHVLDALYAYLVLAKQVYENPANDVLNAAWNFGPFAEDIWPVLEVAKNAIQNYGKGEICIEKNSNAPKETSRLVLDISKALEFLPWKPKWDAEIAIKKTVEWYAHYNQSPKTIQELMDRQIKIFLD
ncbi:CDP-glucose 4,6-dehydratase [Marivirga arenosa]|uniref:CDP-glucose 4,6-dehydratase n=1 Tax=Marivirga arenosa TaxID=3059076 RepID=A0AA51R9J9_9BACT|nr:CDP-glucose 4,6-dehydratase [Marivirga sp. ABR2-2]WMN07701.1 CDP-glucose 4,6-dehydratase [Marivirga sp. ABR2-2]